MEHTSQLPWPQQALRASAGARPQPALAAGLRHCPHHDFSLRMVFSPSGALSALRVQIQAQGEAEFSDRRALWQTLREYGAQTGLPLWVRARSLRLLSELVHQDHSSWLQAEVPTFLATDPLWADSLGAPQRFAGMVVSGRPDGALLPQVLQHTRAVILDRQQERRRSCLGVDTGMTPLRRIPFLYDQCEHRGHLAEAVDMGAAGVVGHEAFFSQTAEPLSDSLRAELSLCWSMLQLAWPPSTVQPIHKILLAHPRLQALLMAAMRRLQPTDQAPVQALEEALALSMRPVLLRALALLPLSLDDGAHHRALRRVALRRSRFLDHLILQDHRDRELADVANVASALSLSAQALGLDSAELHQLGDLPHEVNEALMGDGPAAPWLELALASDAQSPADVAQRAALLFVSTAQVNEAQFGSLLRCLDDGLSVPESGPH